jgi:predicted nucleic acid-binding protein
VIYLDSSALLRLVVVESESDALQSWLSDRPDPWTSSALAKIEVGRAARRVGGHAVTAARGVLRQVVVVPLDGVVDGATDVDPLPLRSLDAIHLASALSIAEEVSHFVAYDKRLLAAAKRAGLATAAPGGG